MAAWQVHLACYEFLLHTFLDLTLSCLSDHVLFLRHHLPARTPGTAQSYYSLSLAQGTHSTDDGTSLTQTDFGLQSNVLLFCHKPTSLTCTLPPPTWRNI